MLGRRYRRLRVEYEPRVRAVRAVAVTRIIAGRFGGRRLSAPAGRDTRPTSDRVREALFSALESRVGLAGARFVDLYAGSGAIGLEALSRGAAHVLLVENDPRAARAARQNIAALRGAGDTVAVGSGIAGSGATIADGGAVGGVRLVVDRVERLLATPGASGDGPYDAVFADPPYAMPDQQVTAALAALVAGGWLAEDAVVVVERASRGAPLAWVPGITADGVRRYGETTLWYGRRS